MKVGGFRKGRGGDKVFTPTAHLVLSMHIFAAGHLFSSFAEVWRFTCA
jgi:hypothetical protein